MKLHEFLLPGAALFCLLALLLLPEEGAQAARDALALCAQTVVPSLFPFFVLSALLTSGSASALFASLLSPLMRPLFSLSGAGASALALGLCGGYPVGARTAGKRLAAAGGRRAAARLLQQRRAGISARRVRRGCVFVEPCRRGAVSHSCRRGDFLRRSHLPRAAAGAVS